MAPVNDFRDLKVWQLAMDLAVLVLQATPGLPPEERYGLAAQLRDAAESPGSRLPSLSRLPVPGSRHFTR